MKKVCILTMHNVDNFGSVLQAYGLKRIVEKLGAEVSFADIQKNDNENQLLNGYNENSLYTRELHKKGFSFSKFDRYIFNRIYRKLKRDNKKQACLFQAFRESFLNVDNHSEKYDLCIIGSDEVFNCLQGAPWGYTSQLFGNVSNANSVISYAASCGSTKYENVPDSVKRSIKASMNKFNRISVRDKNTYCFVTKFVHSKEINFNLDPALVSNFDEEIKNSRLPISSKLKYCLIYAYGYRINKKEEISGILSFCKKHKLVPITLGGPQAWCSRHINCSPFECLKLFKGAAFVITDTFHGTIFSLKYSDRFAVVIRESNRNKLLDLVERTKVRNHVIASFSDLERVYGIEKDNDSVEGLINSGYDDCVAYLKGSLE